MPCAYGFESLRPHHNLKRSTQRSASFFCKVRSPQRMQYIRRSAAKRELFVKFEVPQRMPLASERTPLTLFAPAPSTISFVPLTRNLSLADPSPCPVRGWTGLSEATATRFKASTRFKVFTRPLNVFTRRFNALTKFKALADCSTCPPSTRRPPNVFTPCSNCQQFSGQFFSATAKRGNAYRFDVTPKDWTVYSS